MQRVSRQFRDALAASMALRLKLYLLPSSVLAEKCAVVRHPVTVQGGHDKWRVVHGGSLSDHISEDVLTDSEGTASLSYAATFNEFLLGRLDPSGEESDDLATRMRNDSQWAKLTITKPEFLALESWQDMYL